MEFDEQHEDVGHCSQHGTECAILDHRSPVTMFKNLSFLLPLPTAHDFQELAWAVKSYSEGGGGMPGHSENFSQS